MAFASLADVRRILRIAADDTNEERDAQLQASLDAVESWAETKSWKGITKQGPQVAVYWDIPEDATLHLPSSDCTVTRVRVYEYPSSAGVPLSPVELGLGHGFDLTDDGKLILRPTLFVSPFEGASAQRRLRTYARVDAHYLGTGVIPRGLTEGIAFLAAGHWQDGPRALTGLTGERIGDYSYTLGGATEANGEPSFIARANFWLTPYMGRKQRVMVT